MLAERLPRPADLLLLASLALLTTTLFAAPLRWLVVEWQQNDYYAHGPFVPLTCLVLGYLALVKLSTAKDSDQDPGAPSESLPPLGEGQDEGRSAARAPRPSSIPHPSPLPEGEGTRPGPRSKIGQGGAGWLTLALAGLLVRAASAVIGSDFLGSVALVPTLLGAVGYLAGARPARALTFPIGFLLFAIPLPFMDDLGFYFQRLSSAGAAALLHVVGVPATYQGAELSLPNASFVVGTPCSGLYSTVALTGLGILYARMLGLPSRLQGAALIGLLVPLAIVTNVVRLGSLLSVAHLWGAEVAMAYYHNALDVVFWALAMALLLATGRGVRWIGSRAAA
jgi:exosortase